MSDRKRIEDLEKRVRELEARPYWPPTIIIQPAPQPSLPSPQFVPTWPGTTPWPRPMDGCEPIWYVDYNSLPRC